MAGAISKRQQARNERMLQDLIRNVPGNDRCADCSAKNPGWASWNLGIFLCMRCAALHRKLGTHISKVKSLSMDTWSVDQVDNMKKVGNVASNKIYNPKNVRPDIPIDADEVDAAVEKYIRQKYESRTLSTGHPSAPAARQNTGSTGTDLGSWNEEPPDLPPKPVKRFGFTLRSSSAAAPRQKPDRFTPPLSPAYSGSDRSAELSSPKKESKPGRLFGMKITTVNNNFNAKLAHLQDMGFRDNSRNTEMLKSMNGNLDKTVEALARLGENSRPLSRAVTPVPRALTPVSMKNSGVNGSTVEKRSANTNPWEIRGETTQSPPPVQQRSASVPPGATSGAASWNPFLQPPQSQQSQQPQQAAQPSLDNSFQSLSISATSSPGPQNYGNQQAQYKNTSAIPQRNPWQTQQALSLPLPQPPASTAYGQQYQQDPQFWQMQASSNPFLQQPGQQQSLSPTNPWAQQLPQQPPAQQPSNPFGTSWQHAQPSFSQQPFAASPQPIYEQQTDFFSQPQPPVQQPVQQQAQYQAQQPVSIPGAAQNNPWQQQQQFGQFGQQFTSPQFQQQSRHDKSSILALYNHPQLAPQRPLQTLPEDGVMQQQQQQELPQRSATVHVTSNTTGMTNTNPFGHHQAQTQPYGHVSKESLDFQGFANSGRHSPDAFAGLSARYMK